MRFYFGFSKKIPIKWIIGAILGVLAFFGFTKVHALSFADLVPTGERAVFGNSFPATPAKGGGNILYSFNSSFTNSGHFDFLVVPYSLVFTSTPNQTYNIIDNISFTIYLVDSLGYWNPCQIENGLVLCPLVDDFTYSGIMTSFPINFAVANSQYFLSFPNSYGLLYNINNSSQTIIDNQQSIINSQQDINDSLNDDNTSEAGTSANDFFDDFEVQDTHGISGVITAPIVFLQNLLTYDPNSCSPLSFTLNMSDDNISQSKQLSLPCGTLLWSKAPSSVILIYDTLIWGLLGYRVLIGLNKFFNETLNPESAKEYYLDL